MNKAKWLVFLLVAIIATGISYLILSPSDKKTAETESTETTNSTTPALTDESASSAPTENTNPGTLPDKQGRYENYDESYLTSSTIGRKVLFFHAPWCPQCRELDASIQAGTIPDNVTIIKVDYDSNQSLRSRYGVTIQTTLVRIDDNGNLIKKYVAYEEPSLASLVENLL